MKTLFINACVREDSRTLKLAEYALKKIGGEIIELDLNKEMIMPLTRKTLAKREEMASKGEFDDEFFSYAKQFADADKIVVAAPYWDLSFPALLKSYFERINVIGITFLYSDLGIPSGLCRASRLYYITTSGGKIVSDELGYGYVKTLCNTFYGISDTLCIKAEGLDVVGNDIDAILDGAKKEIDKVI